MTTAISELTGRPVDTRSEAWRFECECSSVLAMPGRIHRNAYLEAVESKRGKPAAMELRDGVMKLYEVRKRNR